ncbi:zinc metalloproteinase nas-14 isoform X2 [Aedes aegypti]|uniref:Metalloendopeptidase n=1 Tax=Aedes aegypti TaxID=7159 RepID=A0A1S4FTY0_AEDAE|nr:zinc metalloproteinase nas-14 isoform X2 [Aedes aegypti]
MELHGSVSLLMLLLSAAWLPVHSKDNYDCETRTGNYEGDIVLTERQEEIVISGRDPVVTDVDKWANNLVPYVIEAETLTPDHAKLIREAMTKIEDESTVRFVPRKQDRDYLVISGETSGCWSTLGRNRGLNRMNISPSECMLEGAIVHQLLHVLGFGHVTNQQDRDFYLDVNWDHVRPEHVKSLNLHEGRIVPNYGMPFDVESIMHFGPNHFSHNGLDTIVPKNENHIIGHRAEMSLKDIRKLNIMYPCGYC